MSIKNSHAFLSVASTDTLKGLAVLTVIANHLANNSTLPYDTAGFAGRFVSIFFVVGGVGAFFSLEKRYQVGFSVPKTIIFLYERFLRMYPLFWIAITLETVIVSVSRPMQEFLGLNCSGQFWFVSSILQCFVLCPILFLGVKKNPWVLVSILLVLNLLSFGGVFPERLDRFFRDTRTAYSGILFLHVSLFVLGMVLARLSRSNGLKRTGNSVVQKVIQNRNAVFWSLFFLVFVSMLAAKRGLLPGRFLGLYCVLPIAAVTVIGLLTGVSNRGLAFVGRMSYSLYLFNTSFIFAFTTQEIAKDSLWISLGVPILLLPVYGGACFLLERASSAVTRRLRKAIPR